MQRSDGPALRRLALWVLVLAGTTTLITLAWNSWLIWYWIIPLFLGEPVMRFIRMTEHVGRPTDRGADE